MGASIRRADGNCLGVLYMKEALGQPMEGGRAGPRGPELSECRQKNLLPAPNCPGVNFHHGQDDSGLTYCFLGP